MCPIARIHTRTGRISTEDLLNRLNLDSIDTYINRRQLRWAGFMPSHRLPKKIETTKRSYTIYIQQNVDEGPEESQNVDPTNLHESAAEEGMARKNLW